VWGQSCGCYGCDGLLELTCEGRTVDVINLLIFGVKCVGQYRGCNGCDGLLE
jgi:hypothetical protein